MALTVREVINHALGSKYPDMFSGPAKSVQHISRATDPSSGLDVIRFVSPHINGAVDPTTGAPLGQYTQLTVQNLEDYSQTAFGHSLPSAIAPLQFDQGTKFNQMNSPDPKYDLRFARVRPSGINENHGWKIHADFVTDLTHEEGLAKAGRAADYSIIDKDLAEQFDKRLAGLGADSYEFFKFYETSYNDESARLNGKKAGQRIAPGAVYADPNDLLTAAEVFEESGTTYKIGMTNYGEGRHLSAYPQTIENRDKLITTLEDRLGNRLVDQNDPAFRARLARWRHWSKKSPFV